MPYDDSIKDWFRRAIRRDPGDKATLLIYRDWLVANKLAMNALEQTKAVVASKYPKAAPHIEDIATSHPEKAVEWVAKSLEGGHGIYPEDKQRFQSGWEFHEGNKGTNKFKETSGRLYPGKNPKNPLDYSLHQIEHIQDEMRTPEEREASKRELARAVKHQGADTYYESPRHKIIRIGGEGKDLDKAAEAACQYGKGTRWCTSNKDTAKEYLAKSPLYVFFRKDAEGNLKKTAQGHFSDENQFQLMNLRDRQIRPTEKWEALFRKSGLWDTYPIIRTHMAYTELLRRLGQ